MRTISVSGGAVSGGEMLGCFAQFGLNLNHSVNNAYLPVTSVDTIASTLGQGFGATDAQLDSVVPNLKNSNRDLGLLKTV